MCEFGVVLVHVVNRAWHLIKAGQPKVALLKDIFVVKLWNGHHVGPLPSIVHDGREALRRLVDTGGGAIARDTLGALHGGAGCVIRDVAAVHFLEHRAVLHISVFFL